MLISSRGYKPILLTIIKQQLIAVNYLNAFALGAVANNFAKWPIPDIFAQHTVVQTVARYFPMV